MKEIFKIPFANRIVREKILQDVPLKAGSCHHDSNGYCNTVGGENLEEARKETSIEEG